MQDVIKTAIQLAELKDGETLVVVKTHAKDYEVLESVLNEVAKKAGQCFISGTDGIEDDDYYIFESRKQGETIFMRTGQVATAKTIIDILNRDAPEALNTIEEYIREVKIKSPFNEGLTKAESKTGFVMDFIKGCQS